MSLNNNKRGNDSNKHWSISASAAAAEAAQSAVCIAAVIPTKQRHHNKMLRKITHNGNYTIGVVIWIWKA